MASLDNILSGESEVAPAPEVKPVEEPKVAAETQTPTEPSDEVIEQDGRKMVPLEALTETRGKVKRYTEEVADFRKQLTETNAAWERRMSDVLQAVRQPQPQPQQQEPPDFFADPDGATRTAVRSELTPFEQRLARQEQAAVEDRLYRIAGDEKAAKIEAELGKAIQAGDPSLAVLQNALRTQGPGAVKHLVDWYDKRTFDPAAERERMKSEILAELKGEQPVPVPQQVQTPVVMPSNLATARSVGARSGPAWGGPTPLGDIFKR